MVVPQFEKEVILCHVLKIERAKLFSHPKRALTPSEQKHYNELIKRRLNHEPIAYLVKNQPFMGLEFYIGQNVLIPRPETELLVEATIKLLRLSNIEYRIADIGTGSGCIAVSLAKYLPNVQVIGIDSSAKALKISQRNAEFHQVQDRCEFKQGDLLTGLTKKFDLIVSNPPYIPTSEIAKLEPDVKDFEPHPALDGGPDGLTYIKRLITQAPYYGTTALPHYLLIEIGYNQGEAVRKLAEGTKKYNRINIIKDLSGHDRILSCQF
ncbi:peptide chain release factor N(5)-glutamine methyltransferase [Candidatus Saganbacteria bacterium CG08_land_8_20_14_0_20_45_16]|uniref:Release factor glutamine methyltransferase n=1 Tax=Candidatus Saganbacteria bacterium CG08_land_8_20_14_0_20_45_16 TaxID=2014293 RepID=A0A2H0Y200_UNCSA|nr:MAG: peptide chain release factor N(5)-glutamine methyltransferase [Candidatus Saganbacteria bacterium CG08_land_8_20_14_0_20_45_16]